MEELQLMRFQDGTLAIGGISPLGLNVLISFHSISDLKSFALGLLGWCEFFDPPIPEYVLKAFEEGKDGNKSS